MRRTLGARSVSRACVALCTDYVRGGGGLRPAPMTMLPATPSSCVSTARRAPRGRSVVACRERRAAAAGRLASHDDRLAEHGRQLRTAPGNATPAGDRWATIVGFVASCIPWITIGPRRHAAFVAPPLINSAGEPADIIPYSGDDGRGRGSMPRIIVRSMRRCPVSLIFVPIACKAIRRPGAEVCLGCVVPDDG